MYLQDSEKASPISHSTCTLCRVQNQPNPTNFQKFKIKNNLNTPSKEPSLILHFPFGSFWTYIIEVCTYLPSSQYWCRIPKFRFIEVKSLSPSHSTVCFFSSSIRCIVWNLNIIAIGITLVIYTKQINENLWYKIPTLELWVWDLGSGSPMFSPKLNNDSKRNWWTLVYEVIPNLKLIKMKWAFYEEEKGAVYYSYFKSYILHYQFFFLLFLDRGDIWNDRFKSFISLCIFLHRE